MVLVKGSQRAGLPGPRLNITELFIFHAYISGVHLLVVLQPSHRERGGLGIEFSSLFKTLIAHSLTLETQVNSVYLVLLILAMLSSSPIQSLCLQFTQLMM